MGPSALPYPYIVRQEITYRPRGVISVIRTFCLVAEGTRSDTATTVINQLYYVWRSGATANKKTTKYPQLVRRRTGMMRPIAT